MIDPQNDAQMLAYWSAIPNLPQKDVNTPGAAEGNNREPRAPLQYQRRSQSLIL